MISLVKKELFRAVTKFNEANRNVLHGDIDLKYAKEIVIEGVHSYTFRLETSEPGKLANLVFIEKEGKIQADYMSFYFLSEGGTIKSYGIAIKNDTYRPLTTYKKERGKSTDLL